ncbi:Mif2/CENP-C like-domain containing protein [Rhodotorula toruloides]|uniref:CENP-C homolog n=1 Tax=Rhodotorula toruloides TaxID=5286 RepID=A0A2T0A6Z4_RHOTO|nr:Mif2/CENP-C like-domain containing protein [Rhodotorula toruloides]PRQ73783.1 Mif2/CENP-C like-domain containing protein [Rhodotorula toruloides]
MAPPTPGRQRGPRPQVNNNIGEAGRTTNIAPPKGVPRDSAGHERPDAFFSRADGGEYSDDDEEFGDMVRRHPPKQASAKKKVVNGARGARGERPDKYIAGEDRGRKTGVTKAVSQRDADGFEDLDNFFHSSSPARSVATTAASRSTVKKRRETQLFRRESPDYAEEYQEEDDSDMMVDDGTSLSPTTYQRQHPSSARAPSSLRHSTNASGAHSVSRKGFNHSSPAVNGSAKSNRRRLSDLSAGDDEDEYEEAQDEDEQDEQSEDEDEDEVVRATLGADRFSGSPKRVDKGKGKARARDEDEDDEEEEEEDRRPAKKRKSVASNRRTSGGGSSNVGSPTGLMKLDRNGRPVQVVDRKGKGKAVERSPSPAEDEEQQFEQQDYYDQDFGGGYDDEEEQQAGEQFDFQDGVDSQDEQQEDEEAEEEQPVAGPSSRPYKAAPKKKAAKATKATKASKTTKATKPSSRRARASSSEDSPPRKASQRSRKGPGLKAPQPIIEAIDRHYREAGTIEIDGVRRTTRERYGRLEYWRNERAIYNRRQSGLGLQAVVRVPKEEPAPLTKAGAKKGTRARRGTSAKPHSRGKSVKYEPPEEEGCDDMTDPDGLVWSWEGDAETSRRIAFTAKMMDPKPTFDGKFSYQKIYQELDYLAGGVLNIPPGGEKGLKPSKDNSYIFYVIEGSVSVLCHRARFTIGPGGTFFIPRGNTYQIVATSNREVKMFFAQGRRVIEYEDGSSRNDTKSGSQQFVQSQLEAVEEEEEEE